MTRKVNYYLKFTARRKSLLFIPVFFMMAWFCYSWLKSINDTFTAEDEMIQRYMFNRYLASIINKTSVVVEPRYSAVCDPYKELPLLVLVASASENVHQRQAVRMTWGRFQPTYFVVGLFRGIIESPALTDVFLTDNMMEADRYEDLIIFDMADDEQNLTLKTALMMNWTLNRCPHARFLMKTEDDVVVNPWTLQKVYTENHDAKLIGFLRKNTTVDREMFKQHYIPWLLYKPGLITQHLDGTAYIMRVDFLSKILKAAYEVPLINSENIYFTYLVAFKQLGVPLRHDWRLNPNKPWLNMSCAYKHLATAHKFIASDMVTIWPVIEDLSINDSNCSALIPYLLANNWLLT